MKKKKLKERIYFSESWLWSILGDWQKHSRNLTSSKNSKNSHILLCQISQKPLKAENKQPQWTNLMTAETDTMMDEKQLAKTSDAEMIGHGL